MIRSDDLFATIESVHSAGLDPGLWPDAIERVARVTGSSAATIEIYDLEARRHRLWHGFGVDPRLLDEYLTLFTGQTYARKGEAGRHRFPPGHVLDRSGRRREPFYSDYLGDLDLSGFAAGILNDAARSQAVLTLRREVDRVAAEADYLRAFELLAVHVGLALRVNAELDQLRGASRSLTGMLDQLDGGVALVRRDGTVLHANSALTALSRQMDGVMVGDAGLCFATSDARRRYEAAVTATSALKDRRSLAAPDAFLAGRPSGDQPLIVAVRPLPQASGDLAGEAVAAVFVHDPLASSAIAGAALHREVYALTPAEAHLASALMRGTAPVDYARRQGVSINTVYTHLRRLKDKTGARRLPDLIRRLNRTAG